MLNIQYASEHDNDGIRNVIRNTSMDGHIRMIFDRHPSYFKALMLEGNEHSTIVGKDTEGTVRGVGTCVFSDVYINGHVSQMGYLHNLRLEEAYRNGYAVALGYKKFRETVNSRNVDCYITSILKDNISARNILTSGKGGLPRYKFLADYRTFVFRSGVQKGDSNIAVKPASAYSMDIVMDFMTQYTISHNLSPVLNQSDIDNYENMHINNNHILCIERNGHIAGLAGIWDISDIKRMYVSGYSNGISMIRPFYNIIARLIKKPRLSRVSTNVSYSYVFPFMADRLNGKEMHALINNLSGISQSMGNEIFIAGCPADSPVSAMLSQYPAIHLNSEIYLVDWNNDRDVLSIQSNPLHIEVARL